MSPIYNALAQPRLRPFLITYDLHKVRHYSALLAALRSWGAVPLAKSVWLANLIGPAGVIRDLLERCVDGDDSIAVLELKPGSDWATVNVTKAANRWLSSNIMASEKRAA